MTIKEALLTELETLPEAHQADVLAYVRFIKIGLANPATLDQQFVEALARVRAIATDRQITDADIEAEIQAVRAGR